MSEFFAEYGLFLAKAVTVVIAIIMIIAVAAATAQARQRRDHKGEIQVTPLNEFFDEHSWKISRSQGSSGAPLLTVS